MFNILKVKCKFFTVPGPAPVDNTFRVIGCVYDPINSSAITGMS